MITSKKAELSRRMIKAGYSGKDLAKAVRVTQGYMSMILNMKRSIMPATVKRICDALNCDFDDVFVISDSEEQLNDVRNEAQT